MPASLNCSACPAPSRRLLTPRPRLCDDKIEADLRDHPIKPGISFFVRFYGRKEYSGCERLEQHGFYLHKIPNIRFVVQATGFVFDVSRLENETEAP